jgi:hypothetical protein
VLNVCRRYRRQTTAVIFWVIIPAQIYQPFFIGRKFTDNERNQNMKKLVLAVLFIYGLLGAAANAGAYEDCQNIFANPETSPYYNYDKNDVKDVIDNLVIDIKDSLKPIIYKTNGDLFNGIRFDDYCSNVDIFQLAILLQHLLWKLYNTATFSLDINNFIELFYYIYISSATVGFDELYTERYEKLLQKMPDHCHVFYHMDPDKRSDKDIKSEFNVDVINIKLLMKELSYNIDNKLIGNYTTKTEKDKTVITIAALEAYLDEINSTKKAYLSYRNIIKIAKDHGYEVPELSPYNENDPIRFEMN